MNTLQIGCVAGLLLLEDVERNEKCDRKRRWWTDQTPSHRLSIGNFHASLFEYSFNWTFYKGGRASTTQINFSVSNIVNKTWKLRWDSRTKRLSVDCTTLRALALTTPPTALESFDAGLTTNWRRQNRSSRFERSFLYISSSKVSAGVATRFVGRLKCRVLSARIESA
jgi:hypothetical protein